MIRLLITLFCLIGCLASHMKLTAAEITSSTIMKAYYRPSSAGDDYLQPIDIKVIVNGKELAIVELKDPKTNTWTTANCACQPILHSNNMSKDFNYQAYHQIYGYIYFDGSGLSVATSSSNNPYASYKPLNSPQKSNPIRESPVVKSRMEIINEQFRDENNNSNSKIEPGYLRLVDNQWQEVSLEICFTRTGIKLVRYRQQNSGDWILVNALCEKIAVESPLAEEFAYKITLRGLGEIYF